MNFAPAELPEHVQNWIALRTSAHWEKQIAESLNRCRVPVYLPLLTKVQIYRSKKRITTVPLFPGYVFCSESDFCGNPAVPQQLRNRIAQIMRPPDYRQLRNELAEVANLLASRRMVQERVYGKTGDAVRIVGSSFAGERGIVRQTKPEKRIVVVEISFLGVRVEIDLDEHLIEKL